jgi:hypothetical protein
MKSSLPSLFLCIAFTTPITAWNLGFFNIFNMHKPPCVAVHFDTLQAIKQDGNNIYFSSRGIHIGTKSGCFVTEVESKDFRVQFPEAYELWQYGMRMAPDEHVEEEEEDGEDVEKQENDEADKEGVYEVS